MRRTILLAMLGLSALAYAQKPCKIEGTVEGGQTSAQLSLDFDGQHQSIEVKDGKFACSVTPEGVAKGWLQNKDGYSFMPFNLYLVPGETLKLTIKGTGHKLDGSKFYKELGQAEAVISPLKSDYSDYFEYCLNTIEKAPEAQREAISKGLSDTLMTKKIKYEQTAAQYLQDHKDSEGAVLFLCDHINLSTIQESLSDKMKATKVGQYVKGLMDKEAQAQAERMKEREKAEAKRNTMLNKPAKDFTLNDLEGKPLALSSLRGKYVVLDWWGSWCGWCIKGIPDMKKSYEKYSDKMEILGIDCNDTEQQWKDCVKKYELPWKHVYNPRNSKLTEDYQITGYPTKIVIDPQGNIIKIVVGEDPAFYTYLDELLGK